MTWFKLNDKFHDSAEANDAGKAAVGVYALCSSWAADNLSDGHIPERILRRHGNAADAARLVDSGLWNVAEGGWLMDWSEQPTKAEVLAKREADRVRKERGRESQRLSARTPTGVTAGVTTVPTRPVLEVPPNPADAGGCPGHPEGPASNCRGCKTNPRAVRQAVTRAALAEVRFCEVHGEQLRGRAQCRGCAADAKAVPDGGAA